MKGKRWLVPVVSVVAVISVSLAGSVWWNFRAKRAVEVPPAIEVIATGLESPWSLDFLPDGGVIFTERPGRIRLLDARGNLLPKPILEIAEVAPGGEGGLLGVALHPRFSENRYVYVYYTYQSGAGLRNKVMRYENDGLTLTGAAVVIDGIPGAQIHDGGRIKFGPDGLLYITTGDASQSDLAQEVNSLAGKILRLSDDGTIPSDNPFPGSPVYSLGHRNPQGLAWDDYGRLWATEHGSSAMDELNLIRPGMNYGWPIIRGNDSAEGLQRPVAHSGDVTWAPSGLAFAVGSLFFSGLRSQSLWRATLTDGLALSRHLEREFGRLRDVVLGPDNLLYITTSNRDGRGLPTSDDDQIIRVNPAGLEGM
ncbi:MAG: PQQ-dependent sugar dehydrogenase [Chloroflexi bacterium]|nr:PQQ-dependent sugar dehydrogenase [Chloroflexota bacterium]